VSRTIAVSHTARSNINLALFLLLKDHQQDQTRTCGRVSTVTSNVGSAHTCRVTHIPIMAVGVRHLLTWWPCVSNRCSVCRLPEDKKCCTPGLYSPCDVTYSSTPEPYSRAAFLKLWSSGSAFVVLLDW